MPDAVVYRNPVTGTRWAATGDNATLLLSWGWLPVDDPGDALGDLLDTAFSERVDDPTSLTRTAVEELFETVEGPVGPVGPTGPTGSTGPTGPQGPAAPDASDTVKGIVELATTAETITGTDTARAVTPAGAKVAYAPLGVNNVVFGTGGLPTPSGQTTTALTGSLSLNNPAQTFMGALHGYAYYNGTEQPGCGSIQGAAAEAYADLTGTITQAVLGFEGIATAVGTGTYGTVIGSQATVQVKDTVSVTTLIGFQGRAPYAGSGTPTVGTAYTAKLQEPTVGTQRYTYYGQGRHTFGKGTHGTVLELLGTSLVKRWDIDGTGKWIGYATDGASSRMHIDPADTPTNGRFMSNIFSGSTKHVSFLWQGTEVFAVNELGRLSLSTAGTTGVKTVEVGATDSGGTGYRMLRVTN